MVEEKNEEQNLRGEEGGGTEEIERLRKQHIEYFVWATEALSGICLMMEAVNNRSLPSSLVKG